MIDWVHKESVTQANVCDTCGHQFSDICGACESLDGVPVQYYPKPSDVRPIKDDGIIGTLDYKTGIFTPTRRITNADRIRHMTDEELATLQYYFNTIGFQTAIDDYGTGYSNVTNLLRYMPNCVKIDRMLLSNIQDSPQKQHL